MIRPTARRCLLAVLGLAALVRLVAWLQTAGAPVAELQRWDQSDMHLFDRWAGRLAAGDWLLERPLHPLFRWQRAAAAQWLDAHPDDPAHAAAEPARALWNRWFGGRRFHQEPLYPYLLGATYALVGRDARPLLALQALFGLLTVALAFGLARRLGGLGPATVAGALAALCSPLVFYEQVVLRASLLALAGLALAWLTLRVNDHDRPQRWLWLGLGTGLALLLKTTFALFALGAAVGLGWRWRRRPGGLARRLGLFAGGLVLCLLPAVGRNLAVGAPPLGLSSVGAMTFVSSNAADTRPWTGFDTSVHMAPILGRTDGALWPSIWLTLDTHPTFGSLVAHQVAKVGALWHWFELPNNVNLYHHQRYATVLAWLPVGFWLVAPLGLLGLGMAWRRRPIWPLLLLVGIGLIVPLAFVPLSRHRLGLLAALLPFAGLAAWRIGDWLRRRRFKWAAAAGLGWLLLSAPMLRPLPEPLERIRVADHVAVHEAYTAPRERAALARGDRAAAARLLAAFLEQQPAGLTAGATPDRRRCRLAEIFGQVHARQAEHLERLDRGQRAERHRRQAAALLGIAAACFGDAGD
jgi:hypothetical protein